MEIRETVEEIVIQQPIARPAEAKKPLLFVGVPDDELLSYGIPTEWLKDVRYATEDTLFDLADQLTPGSN